ncbi:RING/U-box superfamily protein [Striga hermonthica]|uniref:RING/U-box superfamily protein n=1 Tax=Striga hermonthica TaxID=68872 RepID=A0A9N7NF25_STRHE|nr:RING/U-box superfamily protein [Striga hermonthica]
MWGSISHKVPGFGRKRNLTELGRTCHDFSDDETSSNASVEDEGLECPICWESFNIVENVPYVLWCGHTLCKNCVLGLRWTAFKFSGQQIRVPFFVSCPWCQLPTFRISHRGALRFPRKNFFLLWMVESRNGDRSTRYPSSIGGKDRQQMWSPRCSSAVTRSGFSSHSANNRRMHRLGRENPSDERVGPNNSMSERVQLSFHKSIDFFFKMTAKFPLVLLLFVVLFAIPASGAVLLLYLVITIVFAVPSVLVLYFSYTALDWLGREIRT